MFDLKTPDEVAGDIKRMAPEMFKDLGSVMDNVAMRLQRAGMGAMLKQLQAARKKAEDAIDSYRSTLERTAGAAAESARQKRMTGLAATFVGTNDGVECQMILHATLQGRAGDAQFVHAAVTDDLYPDGKAPMFGVASRTFVSVMHLARAK